MARFETSGAGPWRPLPDYERAEEYRNTRERVEKLVELGYSRRGPSAREVEDVLICATCPAAQAKGEKFYPSRPVQCTDGSSGTIPKVVKRLGERGALVNKQVEETPGGAIKVTYDASPEVEALYDRMKPHEDCRFLKEPKTEGQQGVLDRTQLDRLKEATMGPQTTKELQAEQAPQGLQLDPRDQLSMQKFFAQVQPAVADWGKK